MKRLKMATCCQNGALPVGRRKLVQETFLCVLVCSICVPNFVCPRQSGRRGGKFKPRPLPFGHAHFQKRQILKFFTEPDVCAKFPDFSLSFRPPKMRSFREKKKKKEEERRRIIGTDTIGPRTAGARALIKTASSDERALAPACRLPAPCVSGCTARPLTKQKDRELFYLASRACEVS